MDGFEEVDRGGVADKRLTRSRPKQGSDTVSKLDRHVEPAGGIPAPDEIVTPLLFNGAIEDARCRARHRPERVAVEIDHAVGDSEAIAQMAKRIAQVQCDAGIARIDGGR